MSTENVASAPEAGATVWITGLPAAGKSTLALAVQAQLVNEGRGACVLDGDMVREGLSSDLGHSPEDRAEQVRRVAHAAALIAQSNLIAIVALVSPYLFDRDRAREIHDRRGLPFVEVWLDTPVVICERRDPKGMYARARAGELPGLTGVDAPYEPPGAPDIRIDGSVPEPPAATARRVLDHVRSRTLLGG